MANKSRIGLLRNGKPNYGLTMGQFALARYEARKLLDTLSDEQVDSFQFDKACFADFFPKYQGPRGVRFLFADAAQERSTRPR